MAGYRPTVFTIFQLGHANSAELDNTVGLTREIQQCFNFQTNLRPIRIREEKYKLRNGALDLNRAVEDMLRRRTVRNFASDNVIFVTSKPYSDIDLACEFASKSLEEELNQCYFYDADPLCDRCTAIISTFIWDHLPGRPDLKLPLSPSGRRALQPYLLFVFGIIAVDRLVNMSHHEETRGCPWDYCNNVRDIDAFFKRGTFCDEHEKYIEAKLAAGEVGREDIDAVKALFNRALGKPVKYKYHVALSYASPQRSIAETLSRIFQVGGLEVFFDDWYPHELVGKDLTVAFDEVYRKQSQYCVILISRDYAERIWTMYELRSALSRAIEERGREYILPVRVDTTELPGLVPVLGEVRLDKYSVKEAGEIILKKILF